MGHGDEPLDTQTEPQGGFALRFVRRLVRRPAFDIFFGGLIFLNAIFIGAQTEYMITHVTEEGTPRFFTIGEKVFAAFFIVELFIRMFAQQLEFVWGRDVLWNALDTILVIMSIMELLLQDNAAGSSGNTQKVLRMCRMARIIRVLRVLRFLVELRVMVTLIVHSMQSLFWLMCLLILILYVFANCFTQGVGEYVHNSPEAPSDDLMSLFGSLLLTSYTLFISITGGVSWGEVVEPLSVAGPQFTALFLIYIFFCIFSVLNIVTGVFVDGAIQRSSQERDLRLQKERKQKELFVSMLVDLLEEIDTQQKGTISREQLHEAFKDERVHYYFASLEIDIVDSDYLFDMLDLDLSGTIDREEFVSGCLRLKGAAKSSDIHTLMFEVQQICLRVESVLGVLADYVVEPRNRGPSRHSTPNSRLVPSTPAGARPPNGASYSDSK